MPVRWSTELEQHLQLLRAKLKVHQRLWEDISIVAQVKPRTVAGFARKNVGYRNPCIQTVKNIADALDEMLRQGGTPRAL